MIRVVLPSKFRPFVFIMGLIFLFSLSAGVSAFGAKNEVLDRLAEASRGITSIQSEFIQKNHTDMLDEPLRSRGRFDFKAPDHLRWEVLSPERFGFRVDGEEVKTWSGSEQDAVSAPAGAESGIMHFTDQLLAWVRADFSWLEERFALSVVDDSPVTLMLKPRSSAAAKRLEHLRVSFSRDLDHVDTIEIHETGGDRTVITFVDTHVRRE